MTMTGEIVECVVNVSEGRDEVALQEFAQAAGPALLHRHRDADHHRSVFTLAGQPELVSVATRALAATVVARLNLRDHRGAHPRLGALDVVPFVPYRLGGAPPADLSGAVELRDGFARWLGAELGVPAFLYGPYGASGLPAQGATVPIARSRRSERARSEACPPTTARERPTRGQAPPRSGARRVLVAYNVWVSSAELARRVAAKVRSRDVRTLGLAVGARAQVSCNLVDPVRVGPADVYDEVLRQVSALGGSVLGAELVGLVPEIVLAAVPRSRHAELGLSDGATVEARLSS